MSLAQEVRAVRDRIAARLSELEPLVREYEELKQIAAEIGLGDTGPAVGRDEVAGRASDAMAPQPPPKPRPTPRPKAPRARQRKAARTATATSAQPAGAEDELAKRIVEAVRSDPGKTVADYASTLDISPTELYRPVRRLATEGALVKRARALFPGAS